MSEANRFRFRAWDGRKMRHDVACYNTELRIVLHDYPDSNDEMLSDLDAGVLMQSTGLTDTNGVEIFEGDVVALCGITCWIEYDVERAKWAVASDMAQDSLGRNAVTVIGNIYENPGMVESANDNPRIRIQGLQDTTIPATRQ